jgi:hypothetical protein
MNNQRLHLLSLPNELLLEIMSYLDTNDFVGFARVGNQRLREIWLDVAFDRMRASSIRHEQEWASLANHAPQFRLHVNANPGGPSREIAAHFLRADIICRDIFGYILNT